MDGRVGDGEEAEVGVSRSAVPRDQSWELPCRRVWDGRGEGGVPYLLGGGVCVRGVDCAWLRGDAKSLPSGFGDPEADAGGRDAVAAVHVRESFQSVPPGTRACISRAVPGD